MSRSVRVRRTCPDVVRARQEEARNATLYIVHQTGPTGFVLKDGESSKKIKVFLGDPHMCSCAVFKKEHELCLHILWLILRKFRVPVENAVTFQRGLIEREINELLHGILMKSAPTTEPGGKTSANQKTASRKEISPDDVCPICQEELHDSKARLTYCKLSCGQSMHLKCMKIWADHQRSTTGERTIKCPLCREDFGELTPVRSTPHSASEQQALHLGVACNNCHICPIAGKCYKCTVCISYHLCYACFSSNQVHLLHSFQFRQHVSQRWRGVARVEGRRLPASDAPRLPPALVNALQSRPLTHNDYELLQQLDGPMRPVPARVLNSFPLKLLDSGHQLLLSGAMCEVCRQPYMRGDWVRKLPCRHKFHRSCIDQWLSCEHSVCPLDGELVWEEPSQRQPRRLLPHRAPATVSPQTGSSSSSLDMHKPLQFSVAGQRIVSLPGCTRRSSAAISKAEHIADGKKGSRAQLKRGLLPRGHQSGYQQRCPDLGPVCSGLISLPPASKHRPTPPQLAHPST